LGFVFPPIKGEIARREKMYIKRIKDQGVTAELVAQWLNSGNAVTVLPAIPDYNNKLGLTRTRLGTARRGGGDEVDEKISQ